MGRGHRKKRVNDAVVDQMARKFEDARISQGCKREMEEVTKFPPVNARPSVRFYNTSRMCAFTKKALMEKTPIAVHDCTASLSQMTDAEVMIDVADRVDNKASGLSLYFRLVQNQQAFAMLQFHILFIIFDQSCSGSNQLAGWIAQKNGNFCFFFSSLTLEESVSKLCEFAELSESASENDTFCMAAHDLLDAASDESAKCRVAI